VEKNRRNAFASPKTAIFNQIADHDIHSKSELLSKFELTNSTLTRLLEEMVQAGILVTSGLGQSSGGRRPILYEINQSSGYFFGLDLSRRYSSLGFFDMKMNPKTFTRWRMDETMSPRQFVSHLAMTIRSILNDHQLDPEQVIGIGVGAVGPLDSESGTILHPLNFSSPGWINVPLTDIITEQTGIPAYLENGANAALIGEHWALRENNLQHMLYVHAGVGLRSAMMSNGQIVHGSIDMEGAIGQMIIQTDGPRLHDYGNYGALEAFASVQALEKQARADAKLGFCDMPQRYHIQPERINYDTLLQALAQNDPYVTELFMKAASYFGIGLANLINVFHPEKIILGGLIVNSFDPFYQSAIQTALKNTYYYPDYQPAFSKGLLREDAVATGAALLVRQSIKL